eukprot:TRINITY_DN2137_c0_g1_i2.p1 TRINITY_DN2137_c0_g1~~TRINITY_DN2137_c0_g1_i2.p1  ORF type:complete len:112 (+),score=21.25 TRINITY_DN2137_c0_g1_i2:150-485(+)
MSHHASYSMAALLAAGGVMGYAKARSRPSLIAGLAFGALYAFSGYLIDTGYHLTGHELAGGLSVVLAGVMGLRAYRTGKLMPAGAITVVALASTVYQINKVNYLIKEGYKN